MTPREELEAAIEAILFVATEPVAAVRLYPLFDDDDRAAVDEALATVVGRYQGTPAQGLTADHVGGGVRLVTRPSLQGYLRKFFQVSGRTKLSMAALETLAIVAYRQPITGPEIQELRGVSSTAVLKTLLDHRLVRISGRKEVVGKPFLYCTSKEFLIRFGLNRLQDLPPLEDFEQMLAAHAEVEEGSPAQRSLEWAEGEAAADAAEERAGAEGEDLSQPETEEEPDAQDATAEAAPVEPAPDAEEHERVGAGAGAPPEPRTPASSWEDE